MSLRKKLNVCDIIKDKVINNIIEKDLIKDGDRILVGVSGGPDSMCLLDLLNELKNYFEKEKNIRYYLSVAHVNHGIRLESEVEVSYVKNFCKKLNIPVVLHESNAYPGVAVRMLKNKVNKILVGFADAKERLNNKKNVIITGNPIKIKKLDLSVEQKNKIKQGLNLSLDKPVVLAFGGSQGAQSINRSLTEIIVNKKNKDYQLVWATGQEQYDVIKQELKKLNINIEDIENVKLIPYIYNMEEVMYACAATAAPTTSRRWTTATGAADTSTPASRTSCGATAKRTSKS